jgi:hypothetical protein
MRLIVLTALLPCCCDLAGVTAGMQSDFAVTATILDRRMPTHGNEPPGLNSNPNLAQSQWHWSSRSCRDGFEVFAVYLQSFSPPPSLPVVFNLVLAMTTAALQIAACPPHPPTAI